MEREGGEREREDVSNGRLFLNVEKLMYEKSWQSGGRARAQEKRERVPCSLASPACKLIDAAATVNHFTDN